MHSHSLLEYSRFGYTVLYMRANIKCQEEMTKRSRDRDAEMALLAMEEAAANNGLTEAGESMVRKSFLG